jgi:predicted CXXCH cytochrome family protein
MRFTKNTPMLPFLLLACLLAVPAGYAQDDNCVSCHQDWEDDDGPSHLVAHDVHILNGLSCSDCHGGDPGLEDMDEVRDSDGYLGVPDHLEVPDFCARCHSDAAYMRNHNPSLPTDQLDKYRTSVHGQRLFDRRDRKVANCVSCHSAHEIGDGSMTNSSTYPTNLPFTCGKCHSDADRMAGYGVSTTQLEDYRQSVHGHALLENNDLGAPSCNDCHGNHGAAPPGVQSLAAVCGNCHAFEAELFLKSPHKTAYEENEFPMCETCHSNHKILRPLDSWVGTEEPSVCIECHSADDGLSAFAVADSIAAALTQLVRSREAAVVVLEEAIEKGMLTTDEEFMLKEVEQLIHHTRSLVHAVDATLLVPKAVEGVAKSDTIATNSAALIDDYYFRRQGLVVASLIITLLAILLYRRIRRLEK